MITQGDATVIVVTAYDVTYDGAAHTRDRHGDGRQRRGAERPRPERHDPHGVPGRHGDPWTFTDVTGNYDNAAARGHRHHRKANAGHRGDAL